MSINQDALDSGSTLKLIFQAYMLVVPNRTEF